MRRYNGFRKRGNFLMNNLKRKILPLALLALGTGALAGCGQEPTPEPWYVISEKAMDNFFNKLDAASYTVIGDPVNGLSTAVHDQNMVTWFFKEGSHYYNHVCVTVDYETYYAIIDDKQEQELVNMTFMDKKSAVDVSQPVLPSYWKSKDVCGGNIWSLFHNNDQSNPLRYRASISTVFNNTICAMCDFGDLTAQSIQDVFLEFDQVDVTKADLTFTYSNGSSPKRIDGSISIEFGKEVKQSQIVLDWVNNPARPFPAPVGGHSEWPDLFGSAVNNVYSPNIERAYDPLPYDNWFSYATNFNSKTYMYDGYVAVHDFHGTQENANQYMQTLLDAGYIAAVGTSGPVFRSPVLRERNGYQLYADVSIAINDGVIIKTEPYFTGKTFGTRELINAHIAGATDKFPELTASDNITRFNGDDEEFHAYEDRLGFYDYNLFMFVDLEYKDATKMKTYLDNYFNSLLDLGFVYNNHDGTYTKSDLHSQAVAKLDSNEDGVATIIFYNQQHVEPDEAIANINAAGYADFETSIPKSTIEQIMDIKGYFKFVDNMDLNHYYSVQTTFESYDKVNEAVTSYDTALKALGFERMSTSDRTAGYKKSDAAGNMLELTMDYDSKGQQGTYFNLFFIF